ncbi:conserved hypothetical protein [Magnetospirillum sp. LM-5]|nr:conserved hypothetical protein [Magnetospirillum sp. LM-5]
MPSSTEPRITENILRGTAMPNALHPDRMNSSERLDEVADNLAAGLIRLKARKSRALSADTRDSRLDFTPPPQSGHGLVNRRRKCP